MPTPAEIERTLLKAKAIVAALPEHRRAELEAEFQRAELEARQIMRVGK